jgi:hypothetical protein
MGVFGRRSGSVFLLHWARHIECEAKGLALSVWTLVTTPKDEEGGCSNKYRNVRELQFFDRLH